MQRPRVKPHVALVPVSPDGVLVRGPTLFVRYSGEAVPVLLRLVPLLDGTRSPETLARESGVDPQDVRDLLDALAADGVLEEGAQDDALDLDDAARRRLAPQLQLFSHLSATPARLQNAVHASRVVVLGHGALAETISRLVEASGAQLRHERLETAGAVTTDAMERAIGDATHAVLALDARHPHALLAVNEAALRKDIPWTPVVIDGLDASVGPTVIPGESACWRCYDLREKGAHPNLERLLTYEAHAPRPPAPLGLPAFTHGVAALAAQAVVLTLAAGGPPPLAGRVLRVGQLDLRATPHRVLRMPRCPACSPERVPDVDRYAVEPVDL